MLYRLITLLILLLTAPACGATWYKHGTVMQATAAWEEGSAYEPCVMYETGAKVLNVPETKSVWKMWYTGGWDNSAFGYAESIDGYQWTKYSGNPIVSSQFIGRVNVIKNNGTYYIYGAATDLYLWTSTDGVNVTAHGSIMSPTGPLETAIANTYIVIEGGTWHMLYDILTTTSIWQVCYATSSDGITWTKYGSNPVLTNGGGMVGSPFVKKVGETYYLWLQTATTGNLPTNIQRYSSPDLITWTKTPAGDALPISTIDEGVNHPYNKGQVADPHLIEVDGRVYMFYSADYDGEKSAMHTKLAIADGDFADVVAGSEGVQSDDPDPMPVASGSVTLANMRVSVVDGQAHIDFSSAGTLTPYVGYRIVISDSGGKKLTGYITAAGTGQTYSSNLITNGDMELDSGWADYNAPSTNERTAAQYHDGSYSRHFVPSSTYDGVKSGTFTQTLGKLYRVESWVRTSIFAGSNYNVGVNDGFDWHFIASNGTISADEWHNIITYGTAEYTAAGAFFYADSCEQSTGDWWVDAVQVREVLTPSATGVTIDKGYGSGINGWLDVETDFNFKDGSGYSYAIYPIPQKIVNLAGTYNYGIVDCRDIPGRVGLLLSSSSTINHYTVVACPGGAIQATENTTLTNVIGYTAGSDIRIASDKTVTGTYNLFGDAEKVGGGAYSDGSSTTLWSTNPLFTSSYGLQGNSPAKDAGAVLYTYAAHPGDYLGHKIYGNGPDIGAIEYQDHTFGGWFFEMFIPTIFNLCASTNANCYIQP